MNNNDNKLIGAFELQAQVYKKILELKEQGFREEDMYIIAKDDAHVDTLRDKTNVNVDLGTSGDRKNQFTSIFSNDDTERNSYTNISEDTTRSTDYNRDVEDGRILLYVDRDFASSYGTQSTTGLHETGTATNTATGIGQAGESEESLRLHEERLNVDKDRVQTGEVNVGKHVVEEEQSIEVPVEREEVYVERRPVNEATDRETDQGLTDRDAYQENGNIHIPVTEERVEVSKKDTVSEEVVVGKRKVQDTERINETVRREEADIDETDNEKRDGFSGKDDTRGL